MRCHILVLVISHFLNLLIYQRNLILAEQLTKPEEITDNRRRGGMGKKDGGQEQYLNVKYHNSFSKGMAADFYAL